MSYAKASVSLTGFRCSTALMALAAAAGLAVADCGSTAPFENGARCLFIGHSFFIPVADAFESVAAQNDFPRHQMDTVFRGGPAGSPQALWDNAATRAEIEAVLATGEIELFGLTSFSPQNSDFDDYARWIDLALQYNPETRFFVGIPWGPGGPSLDTATFDQTNTTVSFTMFAIVDQLRAAYPDERIEFISYSRTASIMKGMFESGDLPDIVGLTPDPTNGVPASAALFEDPFLGHGGPMMLELAALTWMDMLYGAEYGTLTFTNYQSDVGAIITEVIDFNAPFQAPRGNPADINGDGVLTGADFFEFLERFQSGDTSVDYSSAASPGTPDGVLNGADLLEFLRLFTQGC